MGREGPLSVAVSTNSDSCGGGDTIADGLVRGTLEVCKELMEAKVPLNPDPERGCGLIRRVVKDSKSSGMGERKEALLDLGVIIPFVESLLTSREAGEIIAALTASGVKAEAGAGLGEGVANSGTSDRAAGFGLGVPWIANSTFFVGVLATCCG